MALSHHVVRVSHGSEVVTKIANDASDADLAVGDLISAATRRNRKLLGLDIIKVYKRGRSGTMTGEVASLTLCGSGVCVIFRLLKFDSIPSSLFALLELPDVYFCSAGMKSCLESLRRDFGLNCRNAINVDFPSHPTCSDCPKGDLQSGVSMALSDWGAADLSDEQINYATYYAYLHWHIACHDLEAFPNRYVRSLSNLQ